MSAISKKNSTLTTNILLLLIVILLATIPLFIVKNAEFGGADGEAEVAVSEIQEDYQPWFSPLFEPASGEIESLLFAIQAAIGAGILGFGFGYFRGMKKREQ